MLILLLMTVLNFKGRKSDEWVVVYKNAFINVNGMVW